MLLFAEAFLKFERTSDTLAIVGFAPSTRDRAPWDRQDITIAGLNEEYAFDWFKRKEGNLIWFQLHKRESFARPENHNDPNHLAWLKQKHPFPIFMQEKHKDIPSSIRFPIEKICKEFGNYFSSTLAYLVAWAYIEGYKRVELYGFEMGSDSEYWGQRANAVYIIGKARGKGMDVYVPALSKLLTGVRYAYDNNLVGARQDLEVNVTRVKHNRDEIQAEAEALQGQLFALQKIVKDHPEEEESRKVAMEELKKRDNLIHQMKGRMEGLNVAIKMFDAFNNMELGNDLDDEP